jgi:hypothetical protein
MHPVSISLAECLGHPCPFMTTRLCATTTTPYRAIHGWAFSRSAVSPRTYAGGSAFASQGTVAGRVRRPTTSHLFGGVPIEVFAKAVATGLEPLAVPQAQISSLLPYIEEGRAKRLAKLCRRFFLARHDRQ